ncbi:MAG: hypothetical protein WAN62_13170, partial [Candidatus Acidiferrum sp.]
PEPGADDAGLAHGGVHDARGDFIRGETAFEQAQPIKQFGEEFCHSLAYWSFAHNLRSREDGRHDAVRLAGVRWIEKGRLREGANLQEK